MPIPTDMEKLRYGSGDSRKIQLLVQWLSPSFPLGAFSYSHGLEWAVENGDVTNGETLREWIFANIKLGSGRNDIIFMAHAYRAGGRTQLAEIDRLSMAFASSKERLAENMGMGQAFKKVLLEVWGHEIDVDAYPVALGAAVKLHEMDLTLAATLYLQGFGANLVACGQRLLPVGQTEGQGIIAVLASEIDALVSQAINASLEELGGVVFRSDMASMKHENQKIRIFRT